MDSFYAGGNDDILGCTYVRCMRITKNYDELFVSNEDGLPMRVARCDEEILGTLNIGPFLKILEFNGELRCWGGGGVGAKWASTFKWLALISREY